MPELQNATAPQTGRLLRVLLLWLRELSAGSGTARMPQLIGLVGIIAGMLMATGGCTWQQAYSAGQIYQRNACYKLVDQTERDRCLANANISYDEYRRGVEGAKKYNN
jgi:hypothetical protein